MRSGCGRTRYGRRDETRPIISASQPSENAFAGRSRSKLSLPQLWIRSRPMSRRRGELTTSSSLVALAASTWLTAKLSLETMGQARNLLISPESPFKEVLAFPKSCSVMSFKACKTATAKACLTLKNKAPISAEGGGGHRRCQAPVVDGQ